MSTRKFEATPEQFAIANALRTVQGNIAIDAGAGTGKSSTLLYLVEEHIPSTQNVVMCVFNSRNKEELTEKLKARGLSKASAKTFNGMAYSIFLSRFKSRYGSGKSVDIDINKYRTLARAFVATKWNEYTRSKDHLNDCADWLKKLLHLFMVNTTRDHRTGKLMLFVGGSLDEPDSLVEHTVENAVILASRYGLWDSLDEREWESEEISDEDVLFNEGFPWLMEMGKLSIDDPRKAAPLLASVRPSLAEDEQWVDYSDQVYYAVVNDWRAWQSDWVMVDEAQDLSPLQRALVNKHIRTWGNKAGRVIMVGDPQQAINAWNGADNDGFTNSQIFWNVETVKPLSICWRCFRQVVELSAGWKPGFTAAPDAPDGEIARINQKDFLALVQDGDACISRVRSALVGFWRMLIGEGKKAYILGTNPAEIVNRLLEKIAKQPDFDFDKLHDAIHSYAESRIGRMIAKNKSETDILMFKDEIKMLREVIAEFEHCKTLEELCSTIKKQLTFTDEDKGGIVLLTAHTAKGGEWNNVFDITPDLFPFITLRSSPDDVTQENNLEYVKNTRAIKNLYYVILDPVIPSWIETRERLALEAAEPVSLPMVTLPPYEVVNVPDYKAPEPEEVAATVAPIPTNEQPSNVIDNSVDAALPSEAKIIVETEPEAFRATGDLKADMKNAKIVASDALLKTLTKFTLSDLLRLRELLDEVIPLRQAEEAAEAAAKRDAYIAINHPELIKQGE